MSSTIFSATSGTSISVDPHADVEGAGQQNPAVPHDAQNGAPAPGNPPNEDLLQAEARLRERIAGMSIEEKVGQMFFVRCPETGAAEDVAAYHLGGLLLFGRDYKDADGGWLSAEDLTAKLESYQAAADIPLFIGSDEEGGTVTRASRDPKLFAQPLPSPQELYAARGDAPPHPGGGGRGAAYHVLLRRASSALFPS